MPAIKFNELPAQDAFEQLLPEARALQPELVQPYRGDALLAYHNAKSGAANVLEREEDIKNLPGIDVSVIKNVPNIAMAVKFAADRVNRLPEASDISELEPRVLELRRRMLHAAVSLADSDLLPKREVDNIQAGRGKINHASDAVQLAALFRKHANGIAGKSIKMNRSPSETGSLTARRHAVGSPYHGVALERGPGRIVPRISTRHHRAGPRKTGSARHPVRGPMRSSCCIPRACRRDGRQAPASLSDRTRSSWCR